MLWRDIRISRNGRDNDGDILALDCVIVHQKGRKHVSNMAHSSERRTVTSPSDGELLRDFPSILKRISFDWEYLKHPHLIPGIQVRKQAFTSEKSFSTNPYFAILVQTSMYTTINLLASSH